tara:strand:+ start:1899 stop:2732 length:834 start_codon:yes stop_codon:yes gene_type:complete
MIKFVLAFMITSSFVITQDSRSLVYSANAGEDGFGLLINNTKSYANRFSVNSDYALEALKVTLEKVSQQANVIISIHSDLNNSPGPVIGTWSQNIIGDLQREYTIYTLNECISFAQDDFYWISIKTANEFEEVNWIHTSENTYPYASSEDNQSNWTYGLGFAGASKIYAEIFYDPEPVYGDINFDNQLNVLDVVSMVSYVIVEVNFDQNQLQIGDLNSDGSLDVLDIVQSVFNIVNLNPMPDFELADFNPNSTFNGQLIGPSTFRNKVSVYYFGKQG